MGLFASIVKPAVRSRVEPTTIPSQIDAPPSNGTTGIADRGVHRRTGRTDVYAVRVRETFKGEILAVQAELQLERQRAKGKARKVTEGEIIELMLEGFKTARRNGDVAGNAVPLANDVWQGVHEIARQMQISPAAVVEQLVVEKVAALGLLPRNSPPSA